MGGVCGGSGADSRGIIEGDGCSGFNTGAITEAVRIQVLPQMLPGPSFLDGACVTGGGGEPRYETKLPVSVKSIAETP